MPFPQASWTRSSNLPYSGPCLISTNPHESVDILTLFSLSVHMQWMTKGHLSEPHPGGGFPLTMLSRAILDETAVNSSSFWAATDMLSTLMNEPRRPLPPHQTVLGDLSRHRKPEGRGGRWDGKGLAPPACTAPLCHLAPPVSGACGITSFFHWIPAGLARSWWFSIILLKMKVFDHVRLVT